MRKQILSTFLIGWLCFAPLSGYASELVPIHGSGISECQILLSTIENGRKSDSLAKKIASENTPQKLRESLLNAISQQGREAIKGSDIYITGISMREQKSAELELKKVLNEVEFKELDLNIKVISIPQKTQKKLVEMTLKDIWEKTVYFFPSYSRDFQKPTYGEVMSGLGLTALVEIPTVIGLFKTLPVLDATVTTVFHASLLTALTIYQRTVANWMMRSNNQVEPFLKNLLLSAAFVTNYYIFGNLSPIINYTANHDYIQTTQAFFSAFTGFLVSQGLTTVIQTEFYSKFMQGIRGKWVEMQKTQKENDLAREAGNWVMFLPQMADAFVLSQASIGRNVFYTIGPIELNYWQLGLVGFWAAAYAVYKKPEVLNPVLPVYEKMHQGILDLRSKFKKEIKNNKD